MHDRNRSGSGAEALLSPTLQGAVRRSAAGARPWAPGGQPWVAFFGGVAPVTAIAYLNGKRLGLSPGRLRAMLLIGGLGLIAVVALTFLAVQDASSLWAGNLRAVRLSKRVAAVVVALILYQVQKPADRAYHLYGGGEYDCL